jgi:uncharacterized protein YcaQ
MTIPESTPRTSLSLAEARRLAVWAQALDGRWEAPPGAEGVVRAVERLGYVQIDTISVVERAHHHILWSRLPDYAPGALDAAVAGRRVFEGWSWRRTAAHLPTADYAFYAWRMRQEAARRDGWGAWLAEHADLAEGILARIRDEGPLGSADFAAPEGFQGRGWWDWKPAKRALEHLFLSGRVLVASRKGFQRLYDLPERVLPEATAAPVPSGDEAVRWLIRRILRGQGLSRTLTGWGWDVTREPLSSTLAEMVAQGEVVPVEVEGARGPYYVLPEALERLSGAYPEGAGVARPSEAEVRVLSPFDPLLIDRPRFGELFGRDYRLECYLPAAKRRFGYYLLPLLWGSEIVGRLDAKAHRAEGRLEVRRLEIEPDADASALAAALARGLAAYARMNGCAEVGIPEREAVSPEGLGETLAEALAAGGGGGC